MSDVDEPPEYLDSDFDDHAHQACYVFRPFAAQDHDDRPKKKRKVKHTSDSTVLPLLEHGREDEAQSKLRLQSLRTVWNQKQEQINHLISENDTTVLSEIIEFAASADVSNEDGRLCTGLVVLGSDSGVQSRLLQQWKTAHEPQQSEVLIQLTTSLCPNLQIALRNIIKNVLVEAVGSDGYTTFVAKHKRMIPMNFDLELLQVFVHEHGLARIVVSLLDVETFDTGILSQILWSLSSWSQRIPFVALLGIATTVELFESRLPKSTIEQLETKLFSLASSNDVLYQIFTTFQNGLSNRVFLGPASLAALYELSQSQSTTAESFIDAIKLAVMGHFFANSLSVLASEDKSQVKEESALCAAIRSTDSFQDHCENLLAQGKTARNTVHELLHNDKQLLPDVRRAVLEGQKAFVTAFQTIAGLRDLRKHLTLENASPFLFDIEMYNCLDDMRSSKSVQEILDRLRNISSSKLLNVLGSLRPSTLSHFALDTPLKKLQTLQQTYEDEAIRAEQDEPNAVATTLASNQSTQTPKPPTKANATPQQKQYTSLLVSIISQLKGTIQSNSCTLKPFMHEAFIINDRHMLLSATVPRPRQAIERALARPADYLNCECDPDQLTLLNGNNHRPNGTTLQQQDRQQRRRRQKQHNAPPTSILYNLLQEAGSIINVRDLFDAFQSRLGLGTSTAADDEHAESLDDNDDDHNINNDEGDDDEMEIEQNININRVVTNGIAISATKDKNGNKDKDERMALCLFYRALSELKMLGMVKSSTSAMTKKRALAFEGGGGTAATTATAAAVGKGKKAYAEIDFIAKTSWAGL